MSKPLRIFLGVLLAMQPFLAHAQRAISPLRQVRFQPLQLLFREAAIGYEWPIYRQVSLLAGVGYRFNSPSASPETPVGINQPYEWSTALSPHLQAVKLSFGPVFYLNKNRSMYFQADYFYRHWWVNDKHMSAAFEKSYSDFDVIRTERINVYGLKTTVGVTGQFNRSMEKTYLTYSVYGGIGVRYRTFWYESRDGTIGGMPISYVFEHGYHVVPTLHAGVLLNVGFAK